MFIFSNLATSVDGKIATADRKHFYLGTPQDRKRMQVLRKKCDAILVGAQTLRSLQKPMLTLATPSQPLNIVVSSSLQGLSTSWEFFKSKRIDRLVFTTKQTSVRRIRQFEKVATVVVLDSKKSTALQMVQALKAFKVRRLLVEGGGSIMWEFFKEDLIDEIHVTLTPWILGGKEAPTLVDGTGFGISQVKRLKLVRAKKVEDELFLTYRRRKRSQN